MKIFSNYDDHIFFIDFNNFLRDYKDKNFSFFNTSVEDSDKHISKLFKNYDYNGEHVFIHLGYEPHIPQETDPTLLNLLFHFNPTLLNLLKFLLRDTIGILMQYKQLLFF